MSRARRIALAASSASVALSSSLFAANFTWGGGNPLGPNDMNIGANWVGNVVPVSGAGNLVLEFPVGPSSNTPNQNIADPLVLQGMTVLGSGYVFSGGAYAFQNLGGAPTLSTSAAPVSFNSDLIFSAATTWTLGGSATLSGQVAGGGNLIVNAASNSSLSIVGSGLNTHAGTISMDNGTLFLSRAGTAIGGHLNASNMTVHANFANQFAATSDVTLNNSTLNLYANQQLRDLQLDNGSTIPSISSPTLTLHGNLTSTAGFNVMGNNPFPTLDLAGGIRTMNIASPGAFTVIFMTMTNGRYQKTGGGVLQINSSLNSFTGQNIVAGGSVRGFGNSIGTDVLNNANVHLLGGTLAANTISGTGSVTIQNSVTFAGAQAYTGGTELLSGSALLGEPSFFSGTISGAGSLSSFLELTHTTNQTLSSDLTGLATLRKFGTGVVTITGNNTHAAGSELQQGGVVVASNSPFGTGSLLLGNTATPFTVEALGTRVVPNPLFFPGILDFVGSGDIRFSDTGLKIFNWPLTHNSTGTTTFDGKSNVSNAATITVNSGTLVVGDSTVVNAFTTLSPVIINGGTFVVRNLNFTTLPDVTLAGGTLFAPNGYAIPLGAMLQGTGGVVGRVASANGSSILAGGNLTIGDAAHPAGTNLDGELYTAGNTVTLLDSNQAVLGSYTQLGTPTGNGTLNAANGVVLNFGRNIVGRGRIASGNTLATASIINGDVNGDSITNFIEFTGYVKGVGNFNNVAFSGTFAPGLSPALLTVGNVILTPANVLDMEIGGLQRGTQYDAFDITGTMVLDGQLKLTLINSFNPALGDQFDLFNGTTTGTFSSFNFPPLNAGLSWDTSLLYTQGIVQVVPEPSTAAGLAIASLLAMRRNRR